MGGGRDMMAYSELARHSSWAACKVMHIGHVGIINSPGTRKVNVKKR